MLTHEPKLEKGNHVPRAGKDRLKAYFSGVSDLSSHIVNEMDRIESEKGPEWTSLASEKQDDALNAAFEIPEFSCKDYPREKWGETVRKLITVGEVMRGKLQAWSELTAAAPQNMHVLDVPAKSLHAKKSARKAEKPEKRRNTTSRLKETRKTSPNARRKNQKATPSISTPVVSSESFLLGRAHSAPVQATTDAHEDMEAPRESDRPRLTSRARPNMVKEYMKSITKVVLSKSPEGESDTDSVCTDTPEATVSLAPTLETISEPIVIEIENNIDEASTDDGVEREACEEEVQNPVWLSEIEAQLEATLEVMGDAEDTSSVDLEPALAVRKQSNAIEESKVVNNKQLNPPTSDWSSSLDFMLSTDDGMDLFKEPSLAPHPEATPEKEATYSRRRSSVQRVVTL
eukprot:m.304729 g.304729  ORF g.304729 m.304729 type:complete len:402 (+) comp16438_c0_seq2:194-1399(+)